MSNREAVSFLDPGIAIAVEQRRIPHLSEEAWALLGVLHRAARGGPKPPDGFTSAYSELATGGFARFTPPDNWMITECGKIALITALDEWCGSTAADVHLQQARRHVTQGERVVARQAELVERIRRQGRDATEAKKLLDTFQRSLLAMREHLERELRHSGAGKASEQH